MSPAQAELLSRFRRRIAEDQEHLDTFQEGGMRLLNGRDEDVTEIFMADLQKRISDLEALVEKHDPDGFTVLR